MVINNDEIDNNNNTPNNSSEGEQLNSIIGLGKFSSRKSYYPELQKKIKELEEERNKFQRIFSDALSGILLFNLKGEIQVANPAIIRICGYDSLQSFMAIKNIGNQLFIAKNEFKKLINEVKEKKSLLGFETQFKCENNEIIDVSINASLQENKTGDLIECFISDITQRKRAEKEIKSKNEELKESFERISEINAELEEAKEKAEESDRLKSAFLANMSHEIRTPMNGILGFAEVLANKNLPDDKRERYAKILVESSQQLLSIVNDLLDVSLIESNSLKLSLESVSINVIIKDLYNFYRTQKPNLLFSYNNALSDDDCVIITDKIRIKQVLTNLLNNAFKFTENGFINFGYEVKNNTLQFFVKDSGIGISDTHISRIFERFNQEDLDLTRKYGGTGLGLTISKQLVNLLGGEIWVESVKDKGSVFYFTLPIVRADESLKKKHDDKTNPDFNENLTILIAEDEEINYIYVKEILDKNGIKSIRAKTGQEAVELCTSNNNIDLILMDIKMPIMNGYDATKKIKEIRPDLPIIACTAYVLDADKKKSIESGCDAHVSKPFKFSDLLPVLKKYKK